MRKLHTLDTLESIHGLIESLDLSTLLSQAAQETITDAGISQIYADRILQGEMAIQYGQDIASLSGLAASIAGLQRR